MYGQSVTGKPYFHQQSHNFCFPRFNVVFFYRNRTNRRFSTDLENPNRSNYSEILFDLGEF
jgi:hypothetical protein